MIRIAADVERGIELEIWQEVETEDEKCANDKKRNGTGLPLRFWLSDLAKPTEDVPFSNYARESDDGTRQ